MFLSLSAQSFLPQFYFEMDFSVELLSLSYCAFFPQFLLLFSFTGFLHFIRQFSIFCHIHKHYTAILFFVISICFLNILTFFLLWYLVLIYSKYVSENWAGHPTTSFWIQIRIFLRKANEKLEDVIFFVLKRCMGFSRSGLHLNTTNKRGS